MKAAAKRENAHWYGREAFKNILDAKAQASAAEETKDKGIER
jgi:hypothetical protein